MPKKIKNETATVVIAKNVVQYFGGTLEQGMGIIEDKLKYIRWERQVRLFDKANEILSSRKSKEITKIIPQKFMLPLLESATLEEDDFLQDKWAQLLANAADNSSGIEIKRNYITILENMDSIEVEIFDNVINLSVVSKSNK